MSAIARFVYEFFESIRIAWAQIRANKMRSVLTALGVIIGIVAVTLMGTAINGIDIGFQNSLAMLGEDVLYIQKWPWHGVDDWWNYQNRQAILLCKGHWRPSIRAGLTPLCAVSNLLFSVPACGAGKR